MHEGKQSLRLSRMPCSAEFYIYVGGPVHVPVNEPDPYHSLQYDLHVVAIITICNIRGKNKGYTDYYFS